MKKILKEAKEYMVEGSEKDMTREIANDIMNAISNTKLGVLEIDEAKNIRVQMNKVRFNYFGKPYIITVSEEEIKTEEIIKEGVAETIRSQLGHKALYMLGAKNIMKGTDKDGREYLSFSIMRNAKKVRYIKVIYDAGKDCYIVEGLNNKGTVIDTKEGVYVDQLHKTIEKMTELYTSLGTMGESVEESFEVGDEVEITDGTYKGLTGEIVDDDMQIDSFDRSGKKKIKVYQIKGEGIDQDDDDSWIDQYSLKKIVSESQKPSIQTESVEENKSISEVIPKTDYDSVVEYINKISKTWSYPKDITQKDKDRYIKLKTEIIFNTLNHINSKKIEQDENAAFEIINSYISPRTKKSTAPKANPKDDMNESKTSSFKNFLVENEFITPPDADLYKTNEKDMETMLRNDKVQDKDSMDLTGVAFKKGVTEKDIDSEDLKKGIEVEMEHTSDVELAKKIALDHYAEFGDWNKEHTKFIYKKYYNELKKMEKILEKKKGK